MTPASIYGTILESVQTVIVGLGLGLDLDNVRIRKYPVYLKEQDPLPLVLLTPSAEEIESLQFSDSAIVVYPVTVVLVQDSQFVSESLAWTLHARQTIRKALHVPSLSGASTVFDVDYNPAPPFDAAALGTGLDVSTQEFRFKSQETRAS